MAKSGVINSGNDRSKISRRRFDDDDSDDFDGHPSKVPRNEGLSKVIANHYNSIQESGLERRRESRIFFMRNFNNWIKSSIIAQALNMICQDKKIDPESPHHDITVLDLGCGKGGDLNKFRIGKIKHLVCADIAEESLKDCRQRYEHMNKRRNHFTAEFHHLDCTKGSLANKLKDKDTKFDLVSCQFTFHYSFESLDQAECMMQNISNNLRPGGYFVGTIPDAYDIVARVRRADSFQCGNEIYSIRFDEPVTGQIPLFGAKYDFHLEGCVDCPEFLVYFPALQRLAEKYGLRMLFKRKFNEFFEENCVHPLEEELLGRINALETYPPKLEPLKGPPEDYVHAEKFIQGNGKAKGISHVGTLSKSEWEAVCLYVVFVFVKEG
ncbi:RNA guanine-7 methyltransferase [Brevipalpus obovatus]|uniref:RNA guanine-7 methyltransferase n=1 Tax=Brevipalpus obovatus TaxID=246614 RepID=UPI003D9DF7E1